MQLIWQIRAKIRNLKGDQRGVAYLEFALCMPFLLLFFIGAVDVTRMLLLHQKLDKAAFTMGDLVSQQTEINVCPFIESVYEGVIIDVMRPFTFNNAVDGILVSSFINSGFGPLLEWRWTRGRGFASAIGGAGPGSPVTAPAALTLAPNERVILTEMVYEFNPIIPWNFTMNDVNVKSVDAHSFRKRFYMRGRNSDGTDAYQAGILSGCS